MTTFCWLPPERFRVRWATLGVLMARLLTCSSATAFVRPNLIHPSRPVNLRIEASTTLASTSMLEREPVPLAVLGEVADAVGDRVRRRLDRDRLAVDEDLARVVRDRPRRWPARPRCGPRPTRPDEPEDLAPAQLEADVADRAAPVQVADLQDDLRVGVLRELRGGLEDGPADHHADDRLDRRLGGLDRVDVAAVAHHGHPVGDLLELLEAVRDVDHARPPLAQVADDPEELVDLGVGQRGRRLVHDQDVRAERERLRDLDHLLLGDGEARDAGPRVELEVERLEELGGLRVEGLVVEDEAQPRRAARGR